MARLLRRLVADTGDVPGWVLITVMTAGLVTALWAVAGARFVDLFDRALNGVVGGP
jgi:hypothetical protein